MGSTLRIAHNVFDKVAKEKERKERLGKYDDWQKEKIRKEKALKELKSKIREAEELQKCGTTADGNDSISKENANTIDHTDITPRRRRAISKSRIENNLLNIPSETENVSSTSPTAEKTSLNCTRESIVASKAQVSKFTRTASDIIEEASSPKTPIQNDHTINKRKYSDGKWIIVKDNMPLINNPKFSNSCNAPAKTKALTDSTQINILVMNTPTHTTENEVTTNAGKKRLEHKGKGAGCGGKHCTIF